MPSALPLTPLIVFAKAPQPGQVKTRLIPALGAAGAAALAARLIERAVAAANAAALGPVELCAAPDALHPALAALALPAGVQRSGQGEGDLGARMARALARWQAQAGCVLLFGTDLPGIDAAVLRAAAASLHAGADVVLVPALDGGYGLIGSHLPAAALAAVFTDMPWSTPQVLALTRSRLLAAGWRVHELAPLPDIDEPADLVHLPSDWGVQTRGP